MAADPQPISTTPADVAALLRARTKDSSGNELGEWTDETRPTLEQVEEQIALAETLVRIDVGLIPEPCLEGASAVTALLAAMLVEQAYWPEQVETERSAYDKLAALYERYRLGLEACVTGNQPGGDGTEASWTAYDVATPGRFGDTTVGWPVDWWQRDLDNPMVP